MTSRTYASPEAFKQALEQRLRTITKTGAHLARTRQLLVFDRFLARIIAILGEAVMLKGAPLTLQWTFHYWKAPPERGTLVVR